MPVPYGMMVDVSVVVPTRDRAVLLGDAVRSAIRQRDVDVEVVVVDDGSGEPVRERLEALEDARLRVIRHDWPLGRSPARNTGIACARGDWIAFLDDDDVWAPDKLCLQLAEAERTGAGWVYSGDVVVDEQLRVLAGHPPLAPQEVMTALGRYNPVPAGASNVVVRRAMLEAVGDFDASLQCTEDWDLWLRLVGHGPPAMVRRPLVGYRMRFGHREVDAAGIIAEPERLATRHGITIDRLAIRRRAGWMCLLAGRRAEATWHYLRAAAGGDVRSLGRAAVAFAHPPGSAPAVIRRLVPRDAAWEAEAGAWLTDLTTALARERAL